MPPVPAELAIDTASDQAEVALLDGDRVLAEHAWSRETTFSRELLAAIDRVLAEVGIARDAVTAIAVDAGPGGYSPLRTGVATAQGMALALDVPLAAICRLEADALPHLGAGVPVVAVHDAGRGGIAWAAYRCGARETIEEAVAPRIDSVQQCVAAAPGGATWCGEIDAGLRAEIEAAGSGATFVDPGSRRRAADLVRLARLHHSYGDPAAADVIYLRPPSITRPAGPASGNGSRTR